MGNDFDTWGKVWLHEGKIFIDAEQPGKTYIGNMLESMGRPWWTDTTLFLSLPRRLSSRVWATSIKDEEGNKLPEPDCWGIMPPPQDWVEPERMERIRSQQP